MNCVIMFLKGKGKEGRVMVWKRVVNAQRNLPVVYFIWNDPRHLAWWVNHSWRNAMLPRRKKGSAREGGPGPMRDPKCHDRVRKDIGRCYRLTASFVKMGERVTKGFLVWFYAIYHRYSYLLHSGWKKGRFSPLGLKSSLISTQNKGCALLVRFICSQH